MRLRDQEYSRFEAFWLAPGSPSAGPPGADSGILPVSLRISRPRVLVVDDERLLRWALGESLAACGYDALEAGTIRDAVAIIDDVRERIDAALVDLRLPDGSGLAAIERLRVRGCPAVLMTAYGSPEVTEAAQAAGARFVVAKPFDLSDMMRAVVECLGDGGQ